MTVGANLVVEVGVSFPVQVSSWVRNRPCVAVGVAITSFSITEL